VSKEEEVEENKRRIKKKKGKFASIENFASLKKKERKE